MLVPITFGMSPVPKGDISCRQQHVDSKETPMADDPIRKELDALKTDIAQLRVDIAGLTTAVRDEATDKAQKTKADTQERLRGVWEDLESKLDEVLEQGRSTVGDMEARVGQHPTGSLLTAFGVGFIVAKLLDIGGRR